MSQPLYKSWLASLVLLISLFFGSVVAASALQADFEISKIERLPLLEENDLPDGVLASVNTDFQFTFFPVHTVTLITPVLTGTMHISHARIRGSPAFI